MRGRRLNGRYELLELLGTGGMGEVWRARDHDLDRDVAVKLLLPERDDADPGEREELLARFRREARAAAGLDSPYIVAVHDHGMDDGGSPYLVMTLVDGRTLQQVLRDRGRIPADEALRWAADIARALAAAHAAGVVHRDIKPANVMVPEAGGSGPARVVDFGIARFTEARAADARLTQTGQLPFGSVAYLAPERFRQEAGDGRTDLYALGCVLYELLIGRPPFTGPAAGVMYNHLHDQPLLPSRARRELPAAVDRLVLDLMAKDPADRPADAAAALVRIEEAAAKPGAPEPKPKPEPEPKPKPKPEPRAPRAPRTPVTYDTVPTSERPTGAAKAAAAALAIALVVLLPLIVVVASLAEPSTDAGVTGAPADVTPPPDPTPTPSASPPPTVAIPMEAYADEEDAKLRKRVVREALKDAGRRSGTDLSSVEVVTFSVANWDATVDLFEKHPGTLALVGRTGSQVSDLPANLTQMDTCAATSGAGGTFGLRAPDLRVGKLAGRYLAAGHGVRKVLIGSDDDWATDADRDRFGHGLRAAGLLAEATLTEPGQLSKKAIAQELDLKKPDAVTLTDTTIDGKDKWTTALHKRAELQILHSDDDEACASWGDLQAYAQRAATMPDGSLRFRPFNDETQRPDCGTFPKLCKPSPELKRLLEHRGTAELYDGSLAVAEGLIRVLKDLGPDPDPDLARTALRDAVERAEFDGLLGHYDFEDHRDANRPVWVDRLKDGRWKQVRLLGGG